MKLISILNQLEYIPHEKLSMSAIENAAKSIVGQNFSKLCPTIESFSAIFTVEQHIFAGWSYLLSSINIAVWNDIYKLLSYLHPKELSDKVSMWPNL